MTADKGKYEDECEEMLLRLKAKGVLLIVHSGERGDGFSAAFTSHRLAATIPAALRSVADQIEQQMKGQHDNSSKTRN